MIYLLRHIIGADGNQAVEIAVVESAHYAAQYEAQGFVRCSFETFREAWRQRDLHLIEAMRARNGPPAERAVGQPPIRPVPI